MERFVARNKLVIALDCLCDYKFVIINCQIIEPVSFSGMSFCIVVKIICILYIGTKNVHNVQKT